MYYGQKKFFCIGTIIGGEEAKNIQVADFQQIAMQCIADFGAECGLRSRVKILVNIFLGELQLQCCTLNNHYVVQCRERSRYCPIVKIADVRLGAH